MVEVTKAISIGGKNYLIKWKDRNNNGDIDRGEATVHEDKDNNGTVDTGETKITDKATITSVTTAANNAPDQVAGNYSRTTTSPQYDIEKAKAAVDEKGGIQVDDAGRFYSLTGDELLKALLKYYNLDPAQFETTNADAFTALSGMNVDTTTPPAQLLADIEANAAYTAYKGKIDDGIADLTTENRATIEAAKIKVAELERQIKARKEALTEQLPGIIRAADATLFVEIADGTAMGVRVQIESINVTITPDELKAAIRDESIKKAIGDRAVELIKQDPSSFSKNQISTLQPCITLAQDQRLITFTVDDNEYTYLVQKVDGEWQFVGQDGKTSEEVTIGEGNYEFKDAEAAEPVIEDVARRDQSVIKPAATAGSTEVPDVVLGGRNKKYVTKKGTTYAWEDKNGNGRVDEDERDTLIYYVRGAGGSWIKIEGMNDANFTLSNNRMIAGRTGGDRQLDTNELEERDAVIYLYYESLAHQGMTLENAYQAYALSEAFRNVSLSALRQAGEDITGWFGEAPLSEALIQKTLEDHGVCENIIKAVIGYYKSHSGATAKDLSGYMLSCAMASMTGMYDAFGVDRAGIEKMEHRYNPKEVTKENLLAWLSGEEVAESTDTDAASGSSDDARKKGDLETRVEQAVNEGRIDEAVRIYKKDLKGRSARAAGSIIYYYVKSGQTDKAIAHFNDKGLTETDRRDIVKKAAEIFGNDISAELSRIQASAVTNAEKTTQYTEVENKIKQFEDFLTKAGDSATGTESEPVRMRIMLAQNLAQLNNAGAKQKAKDVVAPISDWGKFTLQQGGGETSRSVTSYGIEWKAQIYASLGDTSTLDENAGGLTDVQKGIVLRLKADVLFEKAKRTGAAADYTAAFEAYLKAYDHLKDLWKEDNSNSEIKRNLSQAAEGLKGIIWKLGEIGNSMKKTREALLKKFPVDEGVVVDVMPKYGPEPVSKSMKALKDFAKSNGAERPGSGDGGGGGGDQYETKTSITDASDCKSAGGKMKDGVCWTR